MLFDDGEEYDYSGGYAFAREHLWMADVRLVVGLDTAAWGPVVLLQTNARNGALIRGYAAAVGSPVAFGFWAGLAGSVLAVAEKLARRFKPAVAEIKRAVLEGGSASLEEGLAIEHAGFAATLGMAGAQGAMAAYVAYTEQTGELPVGVPEARSRLEEGAFVDFNVSGGPAGAD